METATPPREPAVHADLDRKARLCAETLAEAERRLAEGSASVLVDELVHRATDLLDEIDQILLTLHVRRQHGAFMSAANLHRQLAGLLAQVPRALRSGLRRPRPPRAPAMRLPI